MKDSQHGPLAVVTGASGGIGSAIARRLRAEGFHVLLHYSQNKSAVDELASEEVDGISRAVIAQADLSSPAGVEALEEATIAALHAHRDWHLATLVNNAAKLVGPSFSRATHAQFDEYFALNTRAPFFLSQRLSKHMQDGASIVNVSSAGAHFSSPGDIVYAMSKAALESFTKNAAEALAPRGIRINTVLPGFTDNGHPLFAQPEVRDHMSSFAALGGVSDPATVAEAVAFLASTRSSRSTGTVLDVSGGSTLGIRPRTGASMTDFLSPGPSHPDS